MSCWAFCVKLTAIMLEECWSPPLLRSIILHTHKLYMYWEIQHYHWKRANTLLSSWILMPNQGCPRCLQQVKQYKRSRYTPHRHNKAISVQQSILSKIFYHTCLPIQMKHSTFRWKKSKISSENPKEHFQIWITQGVESRTNYLKITPTHSHQASIHVPSHTHIITPPHLSHPNTHMNIFISSHTHTHTHTHTSHTLPHSTKT